MRGYILPTKVTRISQLHLFLIQILIQILIQKIFCVLCFTEYNLPSGIYFYTLNAGEFKETRKMVLVK